MPAGSTVQMSLERPMKDHRISIVGNARFERHVRPRLWWVEGVSGPALGGYSDYTELRLRTRKEPG